MRLVGAVVMVGFAAGAHAQTAGEKAELATLLKPANDPEEGGSAYQMQFSCGFVVPVSVDEAFLREKEWTSANENPVAYCAHAQVAMYEACGASGSFKQTLKKRIKKIQCVSLPSAKDKPETPLVELKGETLTISFGRRSYTRVQGSVARLLEKL